MANLELRTEDLPGTVIVIRLDTGDTLNFTIKVEDGAVTVSEYLLSDREKINHITTFRQEDEGPAK